MSFPLPANLVEKLYNNDPMTEDEFNIIKKNIITQFNRHDVLKKLHQNNPYALEEVCPSSFCHTCDSNQSFEKALEDKFNRM